MSRSKTRKSKSRKRKTARKPPAALSPEAKRMAEEFDEILERAKTSSLTQEDKEKVKAILETLALLKGELGKRDTSLARLRELLSQQNLSLR